MSHEKTKKFPAARLCRTKRPKSSRWPNYVARKDQKVSSSPIMSHEKTKKFPVAQLCRTKRPKSSQRPNYVARKDQKVPSGLIMSHNDVTRIFSLIVSHNDDALGLSSIRSLRNHALHPHVSGKLGRHPMVPPAFLEPHARPVYLCHVHFG